MKRQTGTTVLCNIVSVFYWILTCCYTIAYGGLALGWLIIVMAAIATGSFGLLAVNAVFLVLSVIMIGGILVLLHSALVLRAPRRNDKTIYLLYQTAGFLFSVIGMCVGMALNGIGLMGPLLSIAYYGVMFVFPFAGGIAFGMKRKERSAV